ncbi:cupin domain-containing protein [Halobacterium jilantaiense]|uniref:Cupin domain-containing protein n=1 Tax=Halobacterium jilantaiense TaxID=355548 RepID=A0A1I0MFJ6_9EURY|nr:cupin domain-containing protein [Halobacterium jilantaiense]SEV87197.1 Cupin domain-containing protein [Halobacterium jilantaiense]
MSPSVVSLDDLDGDPHAAVFPGEEPKTVRLTLDAGESVPAHQHPGRTVVCHVLSGEVEMALGDDEVTVGAGEVARFDGGQDISPTAVEPSVALLVLAERPE